MDSSEQELTGLEGRVKRLHLGRMSSDDDDEMDANASVEANVRVSVNVNVNVNVSVNVNVNVEDTAVVVEDGDGDYAEDKMTIDPASSSPGNRGKEFESRAKRRFQQLDTDLRGMQTSSMFSPSSSQGIGFIVAHNEDSSARLGIQSEFKSYRSEDNQSAQVKHDDHDHDMTMTMTMMTFLTWCRSIETHYEASSRSR